MYLLWKSEKLKLQAQQIQSIIMGSRLVRLDVGHLNIPVYFSSSRTTLEY